MVSGLDHTLTPAGCGSTACAGQGLLCPQTNLQLQGAQAGGCRCSSDCRRSWISLGVTSSACKPASNTFLHHGFQCRRPKRAARGILALDHRLGSCLWGRTLLCCWTVRDKGLLRCSGLAQTPDRITGSLWLKKSKVTKSNHQPAAPPCSPPNHVLQCHIHAFF